MIRLKLAKDALIKEIKFLAEMGFAHFELSSGDDLNLLRFELPELIASVKKTAQEIIPSARVSICVTPFSEVHYSHLARCGLDTVFTWQETYDRDTYYAHITSGPKAVGLTDDLSLDTHGDGYLFRMKSQENAIRAGLQAGLGVMLGISPHLEADILSSVIHGNALISRYGDSIEPLIIGMPIWNPITTPKTDNLSKNSSIRLEESDFELISAIYLLGFPDRHAWVFPNCRVSKIEQMKSILTAGCFTSTMVRLGPGAYLAELTNADIPSLYTKIAKEKAPLNKQSIMDGEQFTHTFDFHENYLSMFAEGRLEIVPDRHFLLQN
ncbi:MAG: hypothetical protein Q8P84_08830 [Deltaproteobacteria bacterium]|nr:hypothetical protein [Deltaproteobacteria bacterium]